MTLYYGAKEISFNEYSQFAFGETLAKHSRFVAGDAADWGRIGWAQAQAWLAELIEHGVLRRADDIGDLKLVVSKEDQPSPLPAAPC